MVYSILKAVLPPHNDNMKAANYLINEIATKIEWVNVSHFMSQLLTTDELWQEWKFKTPVIYNALQ